MICPGTACWSESGAYRTACPQVTGAADDAHGKAKDTAAQAQDSAYAAKNKAGAKLSDAGAAASDVYDKVPRLPLLARLSANHPAVVELLSEVLSRMTSSDLRKSTQRHNRVNNKACLDRMSSKVAHTALKRPPFVQAGKKVGSAQDAAAEKVKTGKQYAADTMESAKHYAADTAEAAKQKSADAAEYARKSTEGGKAAAGQAYNKV